LSVEVPLTLNEAFCEHHRKRCPPSDELERECGKVMKLPFLRLFRILASSHSSPTCQASASSAEGPDAMLQSHGGCVMTGLGGCLRTAWLPCKSP
jgi:hypothetical protein